MIDNLKLIELVQEKEFLYNKNLNEFRMAEFKDAAWQEIAEKLECTEADARRRWSSLRDRFTKEIRMRIRAQEDSIVLSKDPWSLYDAMFFIKDHIKYSSYMDNSFSQSKSVTCTDEEDFNLETQYVEFKTIDHMSEEDEFVEPMEKKIKQFISDDEQDLNEQHEEVEVQTEVEVERIEPNSRLPNAQVLGMSRIVIHKLNNLNDVLQNESIETILSYLSAMERYQAGLTEARPQICFNPKI